MRKLSCWVGVLLLLTCCAGFAGAAEVKAAAPEVKAEAPAVKAEAPKALGVGDAVPDFSYPTLDGSTISFNKDIKGKKDFAVLVFMTTACSACQAEIEDMTELLRKQSARVDFYPVSVDIRGESAVKAYVDAFKYKATFLIDPKFTLPKQFGFSYTPASVLIDKSGKIVYMLGGRAMTGDVVSMEQKILSLVK